MCSRTAPAKYLISFSRCSRCTWCTFLKGVPAIAHAHFFKQIGVNDDMRYTFWTLSFKTYAREGPRHSCLRYLEFFRLTLIYMLGNLPGFEQARADFPL